MKILLLTHEYPPFHGGVGRYCQELGRAASKIGHEVVVSAPDYGKRSNDFVETNGVTVRHFAGSMFKSWGFPLLIARCLRAVTCQRFDCIHAADWPMVLACRFASRISTFKYIATVHGSEVPIIKSSRLSRAASATDAYHTASKVVANSKYTLELVRTAWPASEWRNGAVAYLGVSDFWRQPVSNSDSAAIRSRYGLSETVCTIISVGRLDERKGQDRLLASLGRLPAALKKKVACVIVGRGYNAEYSARVHHEARGCGVPTVFSENASDEDLRALLAASDVFCLPGRRMADGRVEGFGLAYLEAAAQQLPSIGPRLWAIPEVIVDHETGLLFDPDSEESLTAALRQVIDDPALRARLGQRAKMRAGEFTWERCARLTYGSVAA